jgi:hypothetical protein
VYARVRHDAAGAAASPTPGSHSTTLPHSTGLVSRDCPAKRLRARVLSSVPRASCNLTKLLVSPPRPRSIACAPGMPHTHIQSHRPPPNSSRSLERSGPARRRSTQPSRRAAQAKRRAHLAVEAPGLLVVSFLPSASRTQAGPAHLCLTLPCARRLRRPARQCYRKPAERGERAPRPRWIRSGASGGK